MRYQARLYASALAELAGRPMKAEEEKKLRQNFLSAVRKNGDTHQLPAIIAETERLLRQRSGRRKVVLETARPLTPAMQAPLARLFHKDDDIEVRVNPELVAGVKVTMDDEKQFDGSLKRKIDKLFSNA